MPNRPVADVAVGRIAAVTATLLCGVTLVFAYLNKARCAGGPFTEDGRSELFDQVKDARVCYSDIQYLWLGRSINEHVFPYITGGITPDGALTGGAVEYPVLSGLLMWLGATGAHDDAAFLLHSALLLAPFALVTAWLLGRMSGAAALLWSAGPPLVLYAFHNWELPVVCTAVAAVYVVTALTRYSLRTRGIIAAVLLGIGFCLKLYPGIFVVPLALYVLVGADRGAGRRDVRGALAVLGAALATVVAINLPFALAGYDGWRASITFQQLRQADITTNSIWYWGVRPMFADTSTGETSFQDVVSTASPMLVLAAFALAVWLGWKRYQATGTYPWIGVSGAMLCGFLLFHKVHSPQYTLWLIPFLVLLEVSRPAIVGYLLADAAIGIGVFRYFYALGMGESASVEENIVQFGVWGRAILLVYFFFAFLRARERGRREAPRAESAPAGELVSAAS
ncbi:glycosyltransferase 87 family protein [Nocardia sp. CDC159]|uniref:Glycosyltransferase 87 family protein n=1 Tax=Nocardia pulmonis TaxID=2951408 RepID=A0A9X2J204_9NOCA|nr:MULTISPECIES: glycosyltransferase 87 family protein [Nocardia]MCM6777536.1 glycosyltransferase 87 family protein [Nocardia pulmonis]MCM6790357.1 glycosyltransferase 87 family protein [Nocardia sp. CDC159]